MSDVSGTVADVMETVISVAHDSSIYQAMNSIENKRIHGLPVVDADNRCLGLLSAWKVSQYLFPPREGAPTSRELFDRSRTSRTPLMASWSLAFPTTPGKKSL